MPEQHPTYIANIVSVAGAIVRAKLREDLASTLLLVDGEAFRVGQVGQFCRVPLGYTQLYAVCTQIGADAIPEGARAIANTQDDTTDRISGFRWMTLALFGESLSDEFNRGIGQYPTVGDEVHLVTDDDLERIYRRVDAGGVIQVGQIAAASGIEGYMDVAALVSRHSTIVGSTGAGKSNLVTVMLEELASPEFASARTVVIDPHGEYPAALQEGARVFRVGADEAAGEHELRVPYWALPLDELLTITTGGLQPATEAVIRDEVLERKREAAAAHLANPPPEGAITADSPIPFSLKRLWYDLDRFERQTFTSNDQNPSTLCPVEDEGDMDAVRPSRFPAASPYNQAPYFNKARRHIGRQLDLMSRRLRDGRYRFLFDPGGGFTPDRDGNTNVDLDKLLADWVGHDKPVTILDVSGLPSEVLSEVVGTVLRVIYDALFWGMALEIGGRKQPLLIFLEEAHRFLPEGGTSAAHRILQTIAKEGRKYGVGLVVVSQRPTEVDATVLSQCGTMVALRTTNTADRARIAATVPDEFGGLAALLPALRTGEGLFVGQALPIPSRIRVRRARRKPVGDDPALPRAWQQPRQTDPQLYAAAVTNWRAQSTSAMEGGTDDA